MSSPALGYVYTYNTQEHFWKSSPRYLFGTCQNIIFGTNLLTTASKA